MSSCSVIVIVAFIGSVVCELNFTLPDKSNFDTWKTVMKNNSCEFPNQNSFQPDELMDLGVFLLEPCSQEAPSTDDFVKLLCSSFYQVSHTLCTQAKYAAAYLKNSVASLTKNKTWDACEEAMILNKRPLNFLTKNSAFCHRCQEDEVCRLYVAGIRRFEEFRTRSKIGTERNRKISDAHPTVSDASTGQAPLADSSHLSDRPPLTTKSQTQKSKSQGISESTTPQKDQPQSEDKSKSPDNVNDISAKLPATASGIGTPWIGGVDKSQQSSTEAGINIASKTTSQVFGKKPEDSISADTKPSEKDSDEPTGNLEPSEKDSDEPTDNLESSEKGTDGRGGLDADEENGNGNDEYTEEDGFEDNDSPVQKPPVGKNKVSQKNGVMVLQGYSPDDGDLSPSSSHFMAYFVTVAVLSIAGYVIYHNKQKIIAYVVEGRRERERRRVSSGSAKYSELKPSMEEVMSSVEKSTSATSKNYIY